MDHLRPTTEEVVESFPPSAPAVVFFTDNGRGLGHLTRLLAVAKRAEGRFRPVFLTMSLGYQLLGEARIPSEFFPAYHQLGLSKQEWSPLLVDRISELVIQTQARAVVVDHVTPPAVFREMRSSVSGVKLLWSRRGLWREGKNHGALKLTDAFDRVVEPGDLAAPIDVGASATQRSSILPIEPIVLLQPEELVSREEARRALGIPEEGRAVLLNLSAPDTESLVEMLERAKDAIRAAAGTEPIHLFAPLHPLHTGNLTSVEGVTFALVYPVARYARAFDGAVSTAGYNSFHEIVASGLPAIFVPHSQTNVDDQVRRARFAELCGRGFWAESVDSDAFRRAVRMMLRQDEADVAAEVTKLLGGMEGAAQFADFIADAVEEAKTQPLFVPVDELHDEDRPAISLKIASGEGPADQPGRRTVMVVVALDHSTSDLAELVEEIRLLQTSHPALVPIFLIGRGSPRALVDQGFAFESMMGSEEWSGMGAGAHYEEYVRHRIGGMRSRYGASAVVTAVAGEAVAAEIEQQIGGSAKETPGESVVTVVGRHARAFTLSLPSLSGGNRRSLDVDLPSDLYVPALLEADGLAGYEAPSLACWMTMLFSGGDGAAFDIGANVGPYAWLAAALTRRKVTAFEPVPHLANALRSVAQANQLEITVETIALADRNGSAMLHLSDQTDSSNSLLEGFRRSSRSIEVDVRTVDSYVDETGLIPHAMKIDTETTEPEVLFGARKTLIAHRPWLIVEVLAQRSEDRLREALTSLGYHWYRIDDEPPFERASDISGDPTHQHMNWLFAPTEPDGGFWDEMTAWLEALRLCAPGSG